MGPEAPGTGWGPAAGLGREVKARFQEEKAAMDAPFLLCLLSFSFLCAPCSHVGNCWVPVVSGSEGFAVGTALVEGVLGSCDKAALFRLSYVTFESFHGDLLLVFVLQ